MKKYREIKLYDENMEDLDISINRIIEEKRKERELKAILEAEKAQLPSAESVLAADYMIDVGRLPIDKGREGPFR